MSSGGHGSSLQPVWKPNWLRTDLVDYSSSTSSAATTTTTSSSTTTTTGTETTLLTPSDEMACLLPSKQGELDEAIWNMMEETSRTSLTEDGDAPQGSSSDIHELTRGMVRYIVVLLSENWATAHQLVDEAAQLRGYVPRFNKVSPLTSLVMETVSCLEEKLAEKSLSFQNQSLMYLFLTNNSYFIWEQLSPNLLLESHMAALARKIDNYIETYLQVSWAPVLSCLYNSTPFCMGRYSSPAKFESEFHKTYNAQKFWKVPDPKLRRRLRVAVIDKVIPSFEKHLEYYNGIRPSRISPQDLMDMLQELFEG